MDWHKTSTVDVLKQLNTSSERGLTPAEAEQRLQQYGLNELLDRGTKNPWKILLEPAARRFDHHHRGEQYGVLGDRNSEVHPAARKVFHDT